MLIAIVHAFEYDGNTNGLPVELYSFSGEIGLWWWQKVVWSVLILAVLKIALINGGV